MTELEERIERLDRLLRSAPVLSKYHGSRGFETERFILDFEAWRAECRLVLSAKTFGIPIIADSSLPPGTAEMRSGKQRGSA